MKNIVIIGSSGHAKVVIDIVEKQGIYKIIGLIDSFREVGEKTLEYSVIGGEIDLPSLIVKYNLQGVIIAIGDNYVRCKVSINVSQICPDLPFVSAIHPTSIIGKGTIIGNGTVIMAGAIINSACKVGAFCIVNTKSTLDHDSIMENFSSLAPGVTVGGNCKICNYSAISIGASLCHGVTIGECSVIGGGSMVLNSIDSFTLAYGVPAKNIRSRGYGDKYL